MNMKNRIFYSVLLICVGSIDAMDTGKLDESYVNFENICECAVDPRVILGDTPDKNCFTAGILYRISDKKKNRIFPINARDVTEEAKKVITNTIIVPNTCNALSHHSRYRTALGVPELIRILRSKAAEKRNKKSDVNTYKLAWMFFVVAKQRTYDQEKGNE
jgi:hypothetical protein